MSQCKVYLENYSGTYYAGSEVRGRLECYFNEETTLRAIKVRIECKEHNSWSGTETYTDPLDHKSKTRDITLVGDNDVLCIEQMLFGSGSGTQVLPRGRHVYPFSYHLPLEIPSSFQGPHGSISYKIKAIVDRPMRFDYEDTFIFVVMSPIDFNHMSRDLQDTSTYSDEKTVCCWCCAGGNVTVDVELPKTAFVPGESVPFKVHIINLSNSNVENIIAVFKKIVKYKVTSPHHESKEDVEVIFTINEHGVGAHGEHTYNLQMAIPNYVEAVNFTKCDLFKVNYELQVCAEMPTCTLDLEVIAWDIQLGNVQFVDYTPSNVAGKPADAIYPPSGIDYPPEGNPYVPMGGGFVVPPGGPYLPPPGGAYPPSPGAAFPAPPGGAYPPPPGGAYPSPPGGAYPPPPGGAYPLPPGGVYPKSPEPAGAPSAPSSSIANAPADDNPKAREAAGSGPATAPNLIPELPPPSYNNVMQQNSGAPYPPK